MLQSFLQLALAIIGQTVADLSLVLRKTIDGLPNAPPELREKVYDKARVAIERQIAAARPPLPEELVEARRSTLDDAIDRTEAHYLHLDPPFRPILRAAELERPVVLSVEGQNSSVIQFVENQDGKIDAEVSDNESRILRDRDAIDRYQEVREAANDLLDSYSKDTLGGNSSSEIARYTSRLVEALGENIAEIRPGLLIPRIEMIRQQLKLQSFSSDELSGISPLTEIVLSKLNVLVQSANILVAFDPLLNERDEARLGPDRSVTLVAPKESQPLVDEALDSGLITIGAASVLAEEVAVLPPLPDISNRVSRRYSEELRNLVRAILAKAWTLTDEKNIKKAVGAGLAAVVAAKWAIANEIWIMKLFAEHSLMSGIAADLISFLKSLPFSTLG